MFGYYHKKYVNCVDCGKYLIWPEIKRCKDCSPAYKKKYQKEYQKIYGELYYDPKRNPLKPRRRRVSIDKTLPLEEKIRIRKERANLRQREERAKKPGYKPQMNLSTEERKERNRQYRRENYLKRRASGRVAAVRKEYRKNIQVKIAANLRARVSHVVKRACLNNKKYYKLPELVGCDMPSLMKHLSSQFKPGMSIDNYGYYGWHIDHIIPCDKFDLAIPEEQKRCFHYSNLQPLWAIDNLKKRDKILAP